MKYFILVLSVLFISSFATANDRYEDRTWIGLFGKRNLKNDYSLWSEFQLRYDNTRTTMQQTLIRFGPLKQVNEKNEIGFLAGYIQTGITKEYRPTLQHVYFFSKEPPNAWLIRSRLEARILEDNDDFSLRLRTLLRFQKLIKDNYSFVLWDEPFVNATDDRWNDRRFFDRNRLFIGTRIAFIESNTVLELGYMNQYVPRNNIDLYEHILTAYLFF